MYSVHKVKYLSGVCFSPCLKRVHKICCFVVGENTQINKFKMIYIFLFIYFLTNPNIMENAFNPLSVRFVFAFRDRFSLLVNPYSICLFLNLKNHNIFCQKASFVLGRQASKSH